MSILNWTLQPLSSSLTSVTLLTNTSSSRTVGGVGHYRPDCLSDSLHSAVKSVTISSKKLQILNTTYQRLAIKNYHRREIKHYFCHLQDRKENPDESEPASLLIVFIEEVRFIYSLCLVRWWSHMSAGWLCAAVISLICHLSSERYNLSQSVSQSGLSCPAQPSSAPHSKFNLSQI